MATCRNCGSQINDKYCPNCGQPTKIQRIDGRYIKHEIGHLLHFEQGIFLTIKELLIRPGKSIREFLMDNRNRLVKPILFIIITSLIYTLANNYFHFEEQNNPTAGLENSTVGELLKWMQDHYGYANIMMGFFIAFFIKVFYTKPNYNYFEILIMLCYVMGMAMLILSFFGMIQGVFHISLFLLGALVSLAYITFGIADFYSGKNLKNYIKSFLVYMLGMIFFYLCIITIGILIDIIKN